MTTLLFQHLVQGLPYKVSAAGKSTDGEAFLERMLLCSPKIRCYLSPWVSPWSTDRTRAQVMCGLMPVAVLGVEREALCGSIDDDFQVCRQAKTSDEADQSLGNHSWNDKPACDHACQSPVRHSDTIRHLAGREQRISKEA